MARGWCHFGTPVTSYLSLFDFVFSNNNDYSPPSRPVRASRSIFPESVSTNPTARPVVPKTGEAIPPWAGSARLAGSGGGLRWKGGGGRRASVVPQRCDQVAGSERRADIARSIRYFATVVPPRPGLPRTCGAGDCRTAPRSVPPHHNPCRANGSPPRCRHSTRLGEPPPASG